ncbi:MAG: DUF2062 domain-containing protein [Cyanobacteria bacterium P01_A01_bin.114]
MPPIRLGATRSGTNRSDIYIKRRPPLPLRQRVRRSLRYIRLRFSRNQNRPAEIARGMAVGAFVGVMPLFGVQTLVAIALAPPLRGNAMAAATTTWVSNPITFIPLYTLTFRIGQHLLGTQDLLLNWQSAPTLEQFLMMGMDCIMTLTAGCVALGIPMALIGYLGGLTLAKYWQQRYRRQRRRSRSV